VFSDKNMSLLQTIDKQFTPTLFLNISITFLFQFINWGIEAKKFQLILSKKTEVSYSNALKSIYAGASTALFTPDRLGNFIGRFIYLKNVDKKVVTAATMLGNFGQLISTITFAFISVFLALVFKVSITLSQVNTIYLIVPVAIAWLTLTYYFYNPSQLLQLVKKIKWIRKHQDTFNFLEDFSTAESSKILMLSLLRYVIFIIQFYLLLIALGINITGIETICFSGLLYLFTTLIPSPLLGNLGTREVIALLLLSNFENSEMALVASLLVWLINIIIPSIIGSFFVLKMNQNKH
jgi:uncharacterized protein (TIRG00374 family)